MAKLMMCRALCLVWISLASGALFARTAGAQMQTASTDSVDDGWPRQSRSGTTTFSVYQPQVDSWMGNQLAVKAAVAVRDSGAAEPAFGVVWLSARTDVDKATRLVSLQDLRITRASFPSSPDSVTAWEATLQRLLPQTYNTIALDRLEGELTMEQEIRAADAQPLRNAPPRIIFSSVPAILIPIDGQPVLRPAAGGLRRVINTPMLLLQDGGTFYLHVFDGWMQASTLAGPWSVAESPPASLAVAMRAAEAAHQVNLLDGPSADSTRGGPADSIQPVPSLASGPAPAIYVSTTPAELIVTDGVPNYVPIDGTQLLYAQNTSARVFKSIADNQTYVLVSGRWYRAPSTTGPWTYAPGAELPADFAEIPDSSPVENVRASVPGTPQAQEAAIENSVPQTMTVKRAGTTPNPAPTIDGKPVYRPIQGTTLRYVLNASIPIIQTGASTFYAVQNGVWFVARSVNGPWSVAASVPDEIYAIPPSSPLYYVTFVQVYGATSDVVYAGYTPGYYGTVLGPGGVVVYGTGYDYTPWIGDYWYGYPETWGLGASLLWTPWGWGFGDEFGFGGVFGFGGLFGFGFGFDRDGFRGERFREHEFREGGFHTGEFRAGEFHAGEFRGGEFRGGEFRGGEFRGGEVRGGEVRGGVIHMGGVHGFQATGVPGGVIHMGGVPSEGGFHGGGFRGGGFGGGGGFHGGGGRR